jgi:hypothetical protein
VQALIHNHDFVHCCEGVGSLSSLVCPLHFYFIPLPLPWSLPLLIHLPAERPPSRRPVGSQYRPCQECALIRFIDRSRCN